MTPTWGSSDKVSYQTKQRNFEAEKKEQRAQPANVKNLLCHWAKLNIIDNNLYRESGENLQLVLPSKLRRLIYEELHSKMGHLDPERV